MTAKEMALTGLAMASLALWEVTIGEIPLGLFALRYAEHPVYFCISTCFELLLAALWLSRAALQGLQHLRSMEQGLGNRGYTPTSP